MVEKNPDYLVVLDRDAAIGTDGAQLARNIMENELVKGTAAYQSGHLIYLPRPAVWYTAEGGLTALDIMLSDLEGELRLEQKERRTAGRLSFFAVYRAYRAALIAAMAPSDTAVATWRTCLTRISPAAYTPGMEVSIFSLVTI